MNAPPDLEGMKILIEFSEDDGFTIQAKPSDDAMLLAALKLAIFAIETKVTMCAICINLQALSLDLLAPRGPFLYG
jgi:hypothetical protein